MTEHERNEDTGKEYTGVVQVKQFVDFQMKHV
jgi:hypothetical protein